MLENIFQMKYPTQECGSMDVENTSFKLKDQYDRFYNG
jgi:hypothetical protein